MRTRLVARCGWVALVVATGLVGPTPDRAAAGGFDILYPLQDRYEPGETASLVGYTTRFLTGDPDTIDWSDTGPFFGYLRHPPAAPLEQLAEDWPFVGPDDVLLKQVIAEDPGNWYGATRVSISFVLPATLEPGHYEVLVCNRPCTTTLGYVGASPLHVGVDPPEPVIRHWPADDPAVAALPDDALVWPNDLVEPVTAGQIRLGQMPPPRAARTPSVRPPMTAPPPAPARPASDDQAEAGAADADAGPADVATGTAPEDDRRGDADGLAVWFVILGLLGAAWWVVWRIGPSRKQVSRPSGHASAPDAPAGAPGTGLGPRGPGWGEPLRPDLPSGTARRIRL